MSKSKESRDRRLSVRSYNSFKVRQGTNIGPSRQIVFVTTTGLRTDFRSMEAFWESGSKQLKRKYRSESVKNPKLIEMALDKISKSNRYEYCDCDTVLYLEMLCPIVVLSPSCFLRTDCLYCKSLLFERVKLP
jgi:hypothetical protein